MAVVTGPVPFGGAWVLGIPWAAWDVLAATIPEDLAEAVSEDLAAAVSAEAVPRVLGRKKSPHRKDLQGDVYNLSKY